MSLPSINNSENVSAVEGEIIYDDDIACPFAASYLAEDDEFDEITAEMDISEFDPEELKEKIKKASLEYED